MGRTRYLALPHAAEEADCCEERMTDYCRQRQYSESTVDTLRIVLALAPLSPALCAAEQKITVNIK